MNLKARYDKAVSKIVELIVNYPWENKDAYAGFLAQTYYYTRHSTKLLTLAASRFDFADYDLHRRFIVHSQEERGHEFMAEKDLQMLGRKLSEFKESTETAVFWQRQYYLIEHVDPICFMGYVLCLEGLSAEAAGKAGAQVKKHYGDKSVLFLRAHSDEDPDHLEKAFKALDKISPERMELVIDNMEKSAELYFAMMTEALNQAGVHRGQKKAS